MRRFLRATVVFRGPPGKRSRFFKCSCGTLAPFGPNLELALAYGHTIKKTCDECGSEFSISGDYAITPITLKNGEGK